MSYHMNPFLKVQPPHEAITTTTCAHTANWLVPLNKMACSSAHRLSQLVRYLDEEKICTTSGEKQLVAQSRLDVS
jgi:hypothetical protein